LLKNIAVIGFGKQGKKLINLFQEANLETKFNLTPIDFRTSHYKESTLLEICQGFDAYVITVPNISLTNELLFFSQFNKPILVEKPVGNSKSDLKKLYKLDLVHKSQIMVNYPFPFSKLAKKIEDLFDSKILGEIIKIEVTHGHGHAWTSEYKNSWRSRLELGVISMSTVHHLHYWLTIFGIPTDLILKLKNHAKSGDAPDTGFVYASFPSGVELNIFSSYAIPNIFSLRIIGTEGIFYYDGEIAKVFSPREVLNASGRHISPVGVTLDQFNFEENWLVGQKKIIENFCEAIQSQKFHFSNFDSAILTLELLISKNKKVFN
jgi:predicted dehydrogenase